MRKGIRRVPAPHDLGALFPYIMKRRCDSAVYYNVDIDVEKLLGYLDRHKPCTFFQAVVLAMVKTMRARPAMNRFLMGRRLYERDDIDVNFIARRAFSDDGGETNVKLRVKPDDSDETIFAKLTRDIQTARAGEEKADDAFIAFLLKFPRFALRAFIRFLEWTDFYGFFPRDLEKIDPLHCSLFLANLGSVGIEAPFHHLFEWGTCSIFVAVGKIGKKITLSETGEMVVKTMVEFKITLDERIADGYYFARSFDIFKDYLENPASLFQSGDETVSYTMAKAGDPA